MPSIEEYFCRSVSRDHFATFDGMMYHFRGDCQYKMVVSTTRDFDVVVNNAGCGREVIVTISSMVSIVFLISSGLCNSSCNRVPDFLVDLISIQPWWRYDSGYQQLQLPDNIWQQNQHCRLLFSILLYFVSLSSGSDVYKHVGVACAHTLFVCVCTLASVRNCTWHVKFNTAFCK